MLVLASAIILRVSYTQFFESHIWNPENYNITRLVPIEASRGNIYSKDLSLLATSIPEYEIRWDATVSSTPFFKENVGSLSQSLSLLFRDKSPQEYEQFFYEERKKKSRYALLKRKVNYNQLKVLKTFPYFKEGKYKSGFIYHQKNKRQKPFKILAERTIGYERKESKSVGLEGAFNMYLNGIPGERLEQKLAGGIWMPIREIESHPGKDLQTTLDIRFQDIAEKSLAERILYHQAEHGCAILMEVKTGAVKAIVNLKKTEAGECVESYNYAIAESAEPGSTFKLASVIAGLEDGYLNLSDTVDTDGGVYQFYDRTMRDSRKGGYGRVSLKKAFEKSSNVGISKLINQHYKDRPEQFIDRLYSMGLNEPLGISISGESKPNIRHPKNATWSGTSLPWMSIGYGIELTPLQTLSFYAAIANDGMRMRPYFVEAVLDNGLVDKRFYPQVLSPSICSMTTIKIVKSMLEGVIYQGTAQNIRSNEYKIAGKTGTNWIDYANKTDEDRTKYQASFVGYFPADEPKYACIVVLNDPKENGSYGGEVAAPVFKSIADYVYTTDFHLQQEIKQNKDSIPQSKDGFQQDLKTVLTKLNVGYVSQSEAPWSLTYATKDKVELKVRHIQKDLQQNIMPNVVGMGLQDAIFLLENYGFVIECSGKGSIKRQSIPRGQSIYRGQKIKLDLI